MKLFQKAGDWIISSNPYFAVLLVAGGTREEMTLGSASLDFHALFLRFPGCPRSGRNGLIPSV